VFSEPRAEERKVPEERSSAHIQDSKHPVRRMRSSDVDNMFHEQEGADREMRLVARDDCAAVDTAKRSASRNPVRCAKSKKGCPEELHEYGATGIWHEHGACFIWREEQHCANDGQAQRGYSHARTHANLRLCFQNIAIGLTGEPVPLGIGNGATINMNSQRLRDAAASLSASKSARSSKWMPRMVKAKS